MEVAEGLDTVRFFPTTDPAQLAAAVEAGFAELPALRRRAAAAAAGVAERFFPQRMCEGFLAVMRAAAGDPR
jgi:hypothetical protein